MSRSVIVPFLVVLLLVPAPARASEYAYGWTISESPSDPYANVGSPPAYPLRTLYLWLACCVESGKGMASAEFALGFGENPYGSQYLAYVPMPPFLNSGDILEPLIAAGGCPCGPVVAAQLLVFDYGAEFCLLPSSVSGLMVTVDCRAEPEVHPIAWKGYSSLGTPPGGSGNVYCGGLPVEETSWGRIKGAYR